MVHCSDTVIVVILLFCTIVVKGPNEEMFCKVICLKSLDNSSVTLWGINVNLKINSNASLCLTCFT